MTENTVAPDSAPAAPPSADLEGAPALRGKIGVLEMVLMVLAWSAPIVVVSGVTAFIIAFAGNAAPMAFGVSMAILVIFAVGFVTMTRYVENPGAFYAYITAGLGKAVGLGSGFLAFVGYFLLGLGTVAFFAVSTKSVVEDVFHGPDVPWFVYAALCVVIVGVLGYFRIDLSAKVLAVAMLLEVGLVGLFDVSVLYQGGAEGLSAEPFSWEAFTSGSIGLGILFAATCFSGFETTAVFREEAKDPRKTVPRATFLAVISIGLLYVISTYALIIAYGTSNATQVSYDSPATMFPDAVGAYVGAWAQDAVSVLVATSAFAAVLSCQNILARYGYSLGRDGVLHGALGEVHSDHGSPHRASILVTTFFAVGTILMLVSGGDVVFIYSQMLGTGGFAILTLIALTGIAIIVFFLRRSHIKENKLRTLVAPIVSTLAVLVVLYLAITNFTLLTGGSELDAVLLQGALWAMFGLGIGLALYYRRRKPAVYARIGRQ
ncbi:APC family permease [Agromyces tropicus]|uniref:APC family permease n=1 Tax=Agromyces tropicus TaxID=555371 RepID=A0ABP5FHA4_9MICO